MNQFQEHQESTKQVEREKKVEIILSGPTSKENSHVQSKEGQVSGSRKMKRVLHKVGSKSENKLYEPRL